MTWNPHDEQLLEAAHAGEPNTLRALLSDGADANYTDQQGRSALHVAVQSGSSNCVELLIASGADVCAADPAGATPLHVAAGRPVSEALLRMLLVASADLLATDRSGWTPLHYAAIRGHDSVLGQLLESVEGSASVAAADTYDSTPLHWAAMHGHELFVARLLEQAHAQVIPHVLGAKNAQGKTAADLSRQYRHGHVTRLLLQREADAQHAVSPHEWQQMQMREQRRSPPRSRPSESASTDLAKRKPATSDRQEVAELRSKFGIGEAATAAALVVRLRARVAAQKARNRERTANLPLTELQKRAAKNVVSFASPTAPVTILQAAIRER